MNIVINYIVESALSLGILTLFYYGFLRNRNIPGFSRWFLLVALVFTSVLPLFHITLMRPGMATVNEPVYFGFMLDMVNIYGTIMKQNVVPAVQQHSGLHWLYLVGLALLVIRLIFAMSKIGLLQRKTIRQKVQGINLIQSEKIFQPFSFLNTVFVPKSFMQNDDVESILQHESIHVKQKHTFDLILLELVLLVQWFNPFVWLLRKAIVENHEFIADRAVLKGGVSVADYQRSLLYQVMGTKFDLGTGFSYSLTKKRFKMMKTKVNKKGVLVSALLSLMLFSGIFFVAASELSVNDLVAPLMSDNDNSITDTPVTTTLQQDDKQPVFQVVEKMPEYPGGAKAMMEFLSKNINYPPEARKNGIQGRVYVNFIINRKGEVSNVKIIRGVDPELDAEALRVVKSMPDWTPGEQRGKAVNVAYNLPINFALGEGKKEVTDGANVVEGEMKVSYTQEADQNDNIISGKVVDENGEGLPGVSIVLQNPNHRISKGTISNAQGNFSIRISKNDFVSNQNQYLVFSFVGLKTVKIDLKPVVGGNSAGVALATAEEVHEKNEVVVTAKDNPDVFRVVEKMPQFPGGNAAMIKYLQKNIHYPDIATKNGIQGSVYVDFIVDKKGKITDVRVKRGVDPSLDKEAVRVVESMPDWIPGTQRGEKVNVVYTLPINFALDGYGSKPGVEFDVELEEEEPIKVVVNSKKESDKREVEFVDVDDKAVDQDVVFQIVEQMPEFPGGDAAMHKYLAETIKYPTAAQEKKIQGKVYVNFIVEKDGSIDNIKVVRSIDPLLDKEAVRVVKAMPNWKPGVQRGKPVRVSYMLPINFLLS
ncbi:TonB family protein [Saccharicrinis sp. FJH54]|uniref:TonB family protein n=1 Tax=Saccharicrinis sp. FJH54 TaxID=3344665 RepID=UPI0035D4CFC0